MTVAPGFQLPKAGLFVGRVWRPGIGPAVVVQRDGRLVDVTSPEVPTMRDLLELDDPAAVVARVKTRYERPLMEIFE